MPRRSRGWPRAPVGALVAAGALSRAASLPLAAALPYARAEGGPGSVLTGRVGWTSALAAIVVALGVAVAVTGIDGAWAALGAAGTALVLGLVFRRWLGGVTGDTLGAVTELAGHGRPARLRRYVNSPREIAWRFARSAMSTSWPSRPT